MAAKSTYSFLDVLAAIVGPGGGFSLGAGAGNSEEGITIEANAEIDAMAVGADGSVAHSLIANKAGKVTIRLLKTSPLNAALAAMLAFQRTAGSNHGQNTITIANKTSGDVVSCQLCAFSKVPTITYAKEAGINEWEFNAGIIDVGLGAGIA